MDLLKELFPDAPEARLSAALEGCSGDTEQAIDKLLTGDLQVTVSIGQQPQVTYFVHMYVYACQSNASWAHSA